MLHRLDGPYKIFPNVGFVCFVSGFLHRPDGVLLQREEVCDWRRGGGWRLWLKWWWIPALRRSHIRSASFCKYSNRNSKGAREYNFINSNKWMSVTLHKWIYCFIRRHCSSVWWITALIWVDTSLPIMSVLFGLWQSILVITLGFWEHSPTQSYLTNWHIWQFFFFTSQGGTFRSSKESYAAPKNFKLLKSSKHCLDSLNSFSVLLLRLLDFWKSN